MGLLSMFKKTENHNIKKRINISQIDDHLVFKGSLQKNYDVSELWLYCRENGSRIKVSKQQAANNFSFSILLDKLINQIAIDGSTKAYDWFLKVRSLPEENLELNNGTADIEIVEINGSSYVEYFIRLGRFSNTNIENLSFYYEQGNYIINYMTIKGNLSLLINQEPSSPKNIQRSEEHTSELQSRGHLVYRLLLEKKK